MPAIEEVRYRVRAELARRGVEPWAGKLRRVAELCPGLRPWRSDLPEQEALREALGGLSREGRQTLRELLQELAG